MALVGFLEGRAGRAVRGAAGVVLIGLGIGLSAWLGGPWWVLGIVGLVPLGAAAANICLFAPLFHEPLRPIARPDSA